MRVLRHFGRFHLFFQVVQLALFILATQLFLDRLHLFVQVVLFLSPLHLAFHAPLDVAVHLDLLHLDFDDLVDLLDPLRQIHHFEQLLFFLDADRQIRADVVGQLGGLQRLHRVQDRVVVYVVAELGKLLENSLKPFDQQVGARARRGSFFEQFHVRNKKPGIVGVADCPDPLDAFDQHLDVAVGQLDALNDVGDSADRVDIRGLRFVDRGIHLCCQEDPLGSLQRKFQRADRRGSPDHKGDHHVRENHHIPDRDHG